MNTKIFERFRAACDSFFQAKADHFKNMREGLAANLAAKTALCEKAEALKDSTDWNAAANTLVALQKEWKTIGPVAHKVSDAVWKRFNDACNYFFEKKGIDMFDFNANAHYLIPTENNIRLYPLAGLTFTRWDFGKVINRLGVNMGAGA